MPPDVYVLFRNDDPCALSDPALERRILRLFERYQIPQVAAVIPHVVDDPHDDRLATHHPLEENPQMVALLREYHAKGLLEIAQHGFTHQTNPQRPSRFYGPGPYPEDVRPFPGRHQRPWLPYEPAHPEGYSEFNGLPLDAQRDKVVRGKRYLESVLGAPIESFVFPWNSLNRPCLELLREEGFRFVPCEDDEHVVDGLWLLGCCRWDIESFVDHLRAALASGKTAVLNLSYHSWMLSEVQIRQLEAVLEFIAREPRIRCLTPQQLPEALPGLGEILRRRAATCRLAARVNRHLHTPHRDGRPYYVMDPRYYAQLALKLRAALLLLCSVDRVGTLFLVGAADGRGPLRRLLDMLAAWVELVELGVRCSPVEALREEVIRSLYVNWRKPAVNGHPTVCVIAENDGWGGTEVHTRLLIERLLARGYGVEYVSGRTNDFDRRLEQLDPARVRIIRSALSIFDQGKPAHRAWLAQLARLQSRTLLLPSPWVEFGSFSFLRACRRTFERIIYIEHTLPTPMPPLVRKRYLGGRLPGLGMAWHRERLRRRYRARCAHRVVTVSDQVRDQLIREWTFEPSALVTVRNGIDWPAFQVSDAMRAQARRAFGLPAGAVVFGMLTRLSEEKGVDLAIEVFRCLLATKPARPCYLVIAGEGPDAQAIKALAARDGLADCIRFLGFVANPLDMLALFDAILFTSRQEGLPLALLEGMAAGVLPIVTRVGGMPEVVNDPALGWVVEPGDAAGVAQAMVQFLALDASALARRRQQARDRIRTDFNARLSYERLLQAAGLAEPPSSP